jgi:hypothetical protein
MRKLTMIVVFACSALTAGVPPAAAIELTRWDGAALNAPPESTGPVLFDGPPTLSNGDLANQAGSHPDLLATTFSIGTLETPAHQELPTDYPKDAVVEVPPGLLGNPQAVEQCPIADLRVDEAGVNLCPPGSQVGVARLTPSKFNMSETQLAPYGTLYPLYNMEPPQGVPFLLGFQTVGVQVFVAAKLRTGGDYGATLYSVNANQTSPFKDFTFEVWGTPADASHDLFRTACMKLGEVWEGIEGPTGNECTSPEAADPHTFLALPTSCLGPQRWNLFLRGWLGGQDSSSFLTHRLGEPSNPIGNEDCEDVPFEPTLEARPTTSVADSPSGLDVDVHIPQDEIVDPEALTQAHLKDATVILPEGLVANPSQANGLGACSPAQIDLHGEAPAHCPDDSKIATVAVDTPLLDHTAPGALYLATPNDNPFGSLFALYLVVDDPVSGTIVKLAGKADLDPRTGRISSTFPNNPQIPFEDFRLHFKSGAHAPLRTPTTCGTYTSASKLTPWTAANGGGGQAAFPSNSYAVASAPGGGCAISPTDLPNSPDLDAGSTSALAGRYASLAINLKRDDGTQQFKAITLNPPPGLLARLAGTESCSEAALAAAAGKSGKDEQTSPSCPVSSRIGSIWAAAGAGPSPYWAPGTAYLAGPYRGAPLSLAIVTPAVAGPFDLGTVVVRVALDIDPETAQITALSDPLPEILEGIPLDIRAVKVLIDRADFTRNGTSCDPLAFSGSLLSTSGESASLSERFQLVDCGRLAFKPALSLRLKGSTHRAAHPKLIATLTAANGEADIARAQVKLPRSAFLDQSHIRTICTRVQWAADACPKGSIYGRAWARSPLLDYALTGNVYLRSSSHKLPDLIVDLRGPVSQPIRIDLAGKTDSVKGALRNSFEAIPDAPVSSFRLVLFGGRRGLIVNSGNVCARPYRAAVRLLGHNGELHRFRPLLRNGKCPKRHR